MHTRVGSQQRSVRFVEGGDCTQSNVESDSVRQELSPVALSVGFKDTDLEVAFTAFMGSSNAKGTRKDYLVKWKI